MANTISPDIPEDYLKQVKEILDHLYDYPYLQNHEWARPFLNEGLSLSQAGQQLRRKFVNAIDSLNPDQVMFFREPEARLYSLLYFCYVEGFSIPELMDEFSLSRRQIYRDLKRGQLTIAKLLYYTKRGANLRDRVRIVICPHVTSIEKEFSQLQLQFPPG